MTTKSDQFTDALRVCCEALDSLPSRDAGTAIGFLADKYINTFAATACYNELPTRSAKERAAEARKSAAALLKEAKRLEAETPLAGE